MARIKNSKKELNLTVDSKQFREINRQKCIRKRDIRSLTKIADGFTNAANDDEILRLAREIVYQGQRKEKAIINEINLTNIKEKLLENVSQGDMFTLDSVYKILWETKTSPKGAHLGHALLAALDDLVKDNVLERKTMVHDVPSGTSHVTVYTVL
jgi:hypothetical protein